MNLTKVHTRCPEGAMRTRVQLQICALFVVISMSATLLSGVAGQYPPPPIWGGGNCTYNADCGIPAANCRETREQCTSLSGSCQNGVCVCVGPQFGCANCAARTTLVRDPSDPTKFIYTTMVPMLDGSGKYVDICSEPLGGGRITADSNCGVGRCIGGHCVCQLGGVLMEVGRR